jgi:hypothetical protein
MRQQPAMRLNQTARQSQLEPLFYYLMRYFNCGSATTELWSGACICRLLMLPQRRHLSLMLLGTQIRSFAAVVKGPSIA